MADLDWSILRSDGPVDVAGNFATGYKMGGAIVDKFHERNALATLANDPGNQSALSALTPIDPQMAEHYRALATAHQQAQQRSRIAQQFTTDPQGAQVAALGTGDVDFATELGKLSDAQKAQTASFWEKAGAVAYQLKQIKDPTQRMAQWQQDKIALQGEGVDAGKLGQFDPTNDAMLDAAITTSQKVGDLINQSKVEWHQQGENPSFATDAMGHPIGTQNPALGGAPVGPTATDAHGNKIHFNPATKAWEPLGGAGGNASGGFQ